MAITIDWATYTIQVPRADMTLVQSSPFEIRELNIDDFRKVLNDLQDDEEGMPFPTPHNHVAPISVGGVSLARVVEILDPYTITFEDGVYAVNLVGANSNIGDKTNLNQVSVRSANSAGLADLSALTAYLLEIWQDLGLDPINTVTMSDDGTTTTKTFGDITKQITDTSITRS